MCSWTEEERGLGALMLVVGASVVILVIAATIAAQSRQALRMASAERDAAQVQAQVAGVFQYTAGKASDIDWPGVPGAPGAAAVDGQTPCNPTTPVVTGQAYPLYCRDVLQRRQVPTTIPGSPGPVPVYQIPVRVRWLAASDSVPADRFGWILTSLTAEDGEGLKILGVFYYQRPCPFEPNVVGSGACKQG